MKREKSIKVSSLATALVLSLPVASALSQVHYRGDSLPAATTGWESVVWSPNTGVPGEGDIITDITGTNNRAVRLDGDRKVFSLGKTSAGNIRFINTAGQTHSLEIAQTLNIHNGAYGFRGVADSGGAGRLVVTMQDLVMGSATSVGLLRIGDTVDSQYVTFDVQGTTTLSGNAAGASIIVGDTSNNTTQTRVDLGHVIFRDLTLTTGASGITAAQSGVEIRMKSLRTEGNVNSGSAVRGEGTLNLYGNEGDTTQPAGDNRFERLVEGGLNVVKSGSNHQIFARTLGNTYTGGTDIQAGVLAVSSGRTDRSALGTGDVVVRNGGTLAASGVGTVRLGGDATITVEEGGVIAPGALGEAGFAELRLNGSGTGSAPILEMESGAEFTFRLGSGGESDRIAFLGYTGSDDFILNNTEVNIMGVISEGIYELFLFKSDESASDSIAGLTNISSGLTGGLILGSGFDGFNGIFHYDEVGYGGVGVISLQVIAIPEPGSMALLGVLGLGFVIARRLHQS